MKITEVRIKLMEDPGERLKAFCSITFDDCFVVRDLKIIEGASGPFVAMPSRKLTTHCGKCGSKNHLRAHHCNHCGERQPEFRAVKDGDGRTKLYADIAHPINSRCREMIQEHVVREFDKELERAKDPNYVSRYDDFDGGDYTEADESHASSLRFDKPHTKAESSRPHHPPHGDPSKSSVAPHFPPGSSNNGDTASGDSRKASGGEGFGAGIF
ncbi:putative septation protein SpoVG [Pseudobythopirellula maris]|uniref:Putative septation protein SpoVG n=1 Tax=Pseudobythopirellula maris TaxID=2527991 RepID=A0A5C5ZP50_9BACT|nr:SpoVG family protein [Pseudobythopirellula maris]TWT88958.1 putative septation protein SpoVG [Pseudobythopirellula maris]